MSALLIFHEQRHDQDQMAGCRTFRRPEVAGAASHALLNRILSQKSPFSHKAAHDKCQELWQVAAKQKVDAKHYRHHESPDWRNFSFFATISPKNKMSGWNRHLEDLCGEQL